MRVTFDGMIFGLQRLGGISTYSWELLRRLAACREVELGLRLPATLRSDRAAALTGLRVARHHETVPVRISRYLPLSGDGGGDIVHSSYYRLPLNGRARRVVTAYDFVYERYRHGLARTVHGTQKRAAVEAADAVLCISQNTRTDLVAAYPAVDPAKLHVTPLAADPQLFFVPAAARRDLAGTVVFVGQRAGYKRFDLAVEAVALAGLRLAVIGSLPGDSERALLDRHLEGRWRATGRIDDVELRGFYAGAYAFIYPSDYEGFGLPILEAQASGCPAVVADRSSFPEVGGDAALYASEQTPEAYAAQLARLADSACRAATIAAGVANAARFSWDRTFDATLGVYRALLQ